MKILIERMENFNKTVSFERDVSNIRCCKFKVYITDLF